MAVLTEIVLAKLDVMIGSTIEPNAWKSIINFQLFDFFWLDGNIYGIQVHRNVFASHFLSEVHPSFFHVLTNFARRLVS